jgi:hypothetical protein
MNEPEIHVADGKLTITVDVSKTALAAAPVSGTGKSKLVASTHGFSRHGPVAISLNVTAPLQVSS